MILLVLKLEAFQKFHNKTIEIVINEHDKEISRERDISPEKRQEIIDELRLT